MNDTFIKPVMKPYKFLWRYLINIPTDSVWNTIYTLNIQTWGWCENTKVIYDKFRTVRIRSSGNYARKWITNYIIIISLLLACHVDWSIWKKADLIKFFPSTYCFNHLNTFSLRRIRKGEIAIFKALCVHINLVKLCWPHRTN